MTQKERLLRYLKDEGSITAYEAVKELGILQLSSRVIELENDGYVVGRNTEHSKNRYGETVYYKRYFLAE